MSTNPEVELENLRDRIEEAIDISPDDQTALQAFDDALGLQRQDVGLYRHLKLLRHCVIIAEQCGNLSASLESREAAETIVRWIHDTYDNAETNQDYRVALKGFGRRLADEGGDPPDSLDWISSNTSNDHDPTPDPGDMLEWEGDIQPMLDAALNPRDRAAIALQWDAGLRGYEFKDLTVGSLTDHKHGLQVTVNGKTGQRTVTLIPSVPYVQRWLTEHPRGDDSDAALWCSLTSGEEISYSMKVRMLKDPGRRAGVGKPLTPTNFRKSSASHLASRGMNQAHIEDHHGWVRGSKVAARYVSVFSEDADRELAKLHGIDVESDEPDRVAPVACPRCNELTPADRPFCMHCNQTLDREMMELVSEVTSAFERLMVESDDADERLDALRAKTTIDENPSSMSREELQDFTSRLSKD